MPKKINIKLVCGHTKYVYPAGLNLAGGVTMCDECKQLRKIERKWN